MCFCQKRAYTYVKKEKDMKKKYQQPETSITLIETTLPMLIDSVDSEDVNYGGKDMEGHTIRSRQNNSFWDDEDD